MFFSTNAKKHWQKTASGICYKLYTNDKSQARPKIGDYIWMHLVKYSTTKKEIFNTRIFDVGNGVEMQLKAAQKQVDVTEIFTHMGKGDSALVKIPCHLLDSNGSKKKHYTFRLQLIDFSTKEAYEKVQWEKEFLQAQADSLVMIEYLSMHNMLDALKDAAGNYFVRQIRGTGAQLQIGDSVQLHYIGKLTTDFEFDNSYGRKQTLAFVVGKQQVIEGLDKGICNFYYGDKGILLIPSRLAYGDKSVGKIPANAVLVFDIDILPK